MSTHAASVKMPVIKEHKVKPQGSSGLSAKQAATAIGLILACTVAAGAVLLGFGELIGYLF